jgi:hypothetical protein
VRYVNEKTREAITANYESYYRYAYKVASNKCTLFSKVKDVDLINDLVQGAFEAALYGSEVDWKIRRNMSFGIMDELTRWTFEVCYRGRRYRKRPDKTRLSPGIDIDVFDLEAYVARKTLVGKYLKFCPDTPRYISVLRILVDRDDIAPTQSLREEGLTKDNYYFSKKRLLRLMRNGVTLDSFSSLGELMGS